MNLSFVFSLLLLISCTCQPMEKASGRVKQILSYTNSLFKELKINKFLLAICDDNNPVRLLQRAHTYFYERPSSMIPPNSLATLSKKISNYGKLSLCAINKDEFEKKWVLISVIQELEQHCCSLNTINEFLTDAQETMDEGDKNNQTFKNYVDCINTYVQIAQHGIKICSHHDSIEAFEAQPFEHIKELSKKTNKELSRSLSLYSLIMLNENYKQKNNGNSLLHALCEQKLDDIEFETVSHFLIHNDLGFNCLNTQKLTPLAYGISLNISEKKQQILKALGCKVETKNNRKITLSSGIQEQQQCKQ